MAVIFFAIAFLASIAGAITGVGGGIIIKPVIDATNLLQPAQVNFLSGNAVLAMTIVSLAQNFIKKGEKIDWSRSLFLSIGAAAGGLIGGQAFSCRSVQPPVASLEVKPSSRSSVYSRMRSSSN